jgi:uncharacterized membrane protein
MRSNMKFKNFIICGLTGWCIEIIYTSIKNLIHRDGRLIGQTSLWMFPIYGLAFFIEPIYGRINKVPALLRGVVYSIGIFSCEYASGSLLKKFSVCPWDYSAEKANINGLIRLDYAPYWAFTGLLFEHILCRASIGQKSS